MSRLLLDFLFLGTLTSRSFFGLEGDGITADQPSDTKQPILRVYRGGCRYRLVKSLEI